MICISKRKRYGMKQKNSIENIELFFVCPQNWDEMTICGNGRFCGVCQKTVYDFTDKSQAAYQDIVQKHNGQVCGRFRKAQMTPSVNWAKVAALAALGSFAVAGNAQKVDSIVIEKPVKFIEKNEFMGLIVETQPGFIGGTKAMFEFLRKNIVYPNNYGTYNGIVFIGFEVDTNGDLSNIKVKRGFHPQFDAEAVRVVKLMSKGYWKGATQSGKSVKVAYTIPIKFSVE